jgi:uncharacterized membrane protein
MTNFLTTVIVIILLAAWRGFFSTITKHNITKHETNTAKHNTAERRLVLLHCLARLLSVAVVETYRTVLLHQSRSLSFIASYFVAGTRSLL